MPCAEALKEDISNKRDKPKEVVGVSEFAIIVSEIKGFFWHRVSVEVWFCSHDEQGQSRIITF